MPPNKTLPSLPPSYPSHYKKKYFIIRTKRKKIEKKKSTVAEASIYAVFLLRQSCPTYPPQAYV